LNCCNQLLGFLVKEAKFILNWKMVSGCKILRFLLT